MIDELLDSLVSTSRATSRAAAELDELCRARRTRTDLAQFQDKELLRIGVRDILNKDVIQSRRRN